jgi:alpha-1,2-mannosyltransferase
VIACAATTNLGARALLGHAVPGDFAQEVIAANSVRARTTLYPEDANGAVAEWLARDPPVLPGWLPDTASRWLEDRQRGGRNRLAAQAHPPTLLLAMAIPVLLLGPYAAYWALTVITVAGAAFTAHLLMRILAPAASRRQRVLAMIALASWQPVLATVRDGQVSVVVGTLLVLAWADLRRGRDTRAGLAVGAAAALKLYPLVVLVLLAVRRPRAFAVAGAVIAGAAAAVLGVAGPDTWVEYATSARLIAKAFATEPYNLSLVARLPGILSSAVVPVTYAALAGIAIAASLMAGRRSAGSGQELGTGDVEFAGFVTIALLLSPVAWHHYVFMLALPLVVIVIAAWTRGSRAALAYACALVVLLSAPDDLWRALWSRTPARLGLLLSPGLAVLLLWAALLRAHGARVAGAADGAAVRHPAASR